MVIEYTAQLGAEEVFLPGKESANTRLAILSLRLQAIQRLMEMKI